MAASGADSMADNEVVIVAAAFCPQPPLPHPELDALSGRDGDVLLDLYQAIAHRVLAAGLAAWHEAGTIPHGRAMTPRLHCAGAPFGVFCVAAGRVLAAPA